jgi:hypothetical protein
MLFVEDQSKFWDYIDYNSGIWMILKESFYDLK